MSDLVNNNITSFTTLLIEWSRMDRCGLILSSIFDRIVELAYLESPLKPTQNHMIYSVLLQCFHKHHVKSDIGN